LRRHYEKQKGFENYGIATVCGDFLYIMKNMMYFYWCDTQTVGETNRKYMLFPENLPTDYEIIISLDAYKRAPID